MEKQSNLKRVTEIIKFLSKEIPDPTIALKFSNPLELLIATILSAQCTDVRVNEVTTDRFLESDSLVRREMRAWTAEVLKHRPGAWTVQGRVADGSGNGVSGVRVQCGNWHWSTTDSEGRYQIPGLIPGRRVLVAQKTGLLLQARLHEIVLGQSDVEAKPFLAELEKGGNR